MGKLYIIGNGLDLHFRLKTRPEDFIEKLKMQRIVGEMENAYEVLLNSYSIDWSEYENSLADIDLDEIEEQNIGFPDYLSDHESDRDGVIYNMQMYVDSIKAAVQAALTDMVDDANEAVEVIASAKGFPRILPDASAVLSFNYTSTLEQLFQLTDKTPVLHIHGSREDGDYLIFGYGQAKGNYQQKLLPDENGDFYVDRQRESIYEFYKNLGKKYQMAALDRFLRCCHGITEVVVLGHSMGLVDAPYMERIEAIIHPNIWKVSYYNDSADLRRNLATYSFCAKCIPFPF